MPEIFEILTEYIQQEKLVALATVIAGPGLGSKLLIWPDGASQGSLGTDSLNQQIIQRTRELFHAMEPERLSLEVSGEMVEIFIEIFPPPARLVIIGAVHIAIPLVRFAETLNLHTIVIDPRSAFATRERFPGVDELIVQWPVEALNALNINESTFIVTLSHDEKLDNPALEVALNSPARYIGALGSRKTHAKRVSALKAAGLTEEQINRIHAPIGLNIAARGAAEIALSIIAQIVAVDHGIDRNL